jgi:hypothetical protein
MKPNPAALVVALACLGLLMGAPTVAHHSFSAQFDGSKPLEIAGVVTKLEWKNPHVYFYVDVTGRDGQVVNWACETNGPGGLIRQGWKRDSLKEGDRVTVNGYPARDGSKTMDARRTTLADGRRVFGGTAGDGGPAR